MLVCAFLSYHILNMAHYQTLYATSVINLSSLWHHKVCRNLWGENMLIYWIYCICCNFFVNIFCPRVFSVWTVRKDFIIQSLSQFCQDTYHLYAWRDWRQEREGRDGRERGLWWWLEVTGREKSDHFYQDRFDVGFKMIYFNSMLISKYFYVVFSWCDFEDYLVL